MSYPVIVKVEKESPADAVGIMPGDEIVTINGIVPRDVIEYRLAADESFVELELSRGGLTFQTEVVKQAGIPLGIEVSSPVFDKIRTCDNHCEFCFIYQLPKNMRRSLYMKDDDYRLSFLYGNFTTLTRFTEADLQRVTEEGLSPLYVSIHSTNPDLRAEMLRNKRGATSLRFLRALLDNGVTVHGQIVVCPGVNDGERFEETLAGILEEYPKLASVAAVPLGISRYSAEKRMRAHTPEEIDYILDAVEYWQQIFKKTLKKRMIFAADEYYILANRPFPQAKDYEGFPQLENGIGMARAFVDSFRSGKQHVASVRGGFFQSVDGAPDYGYRANRLGEAKHSDGAGDKTEGIRSCGSGDIDGNINTAANGDAAYACLDHTSIGTFVRVPVIIGKNGKKKSAIKKDRSSLPITLISSRYGKKVLEEAIGSHALTDHGYLDILAVENSFFGGNTSVTGLLTGEDLAKVLVGLDPDRRYILPDVCLNEGIFLDGMRPEELPVKVEIISSEGDVLRKLLDEVSATFLDAAYIGQDELRV